MSVDSGDCYTPLNHQPLIVTWFPFNVSCQQIVTSHCTLYMYFRPKHDLTLVASWETGEQAADAGERCTVRRTGACNWQRCTFNDTGSFMDFNVPTAAQGALGRNRTFQTLLYQFQHISPHSQDLAHSSEHSTVNSKQNPVKIGRISVLHILGDRWSILLQAKRRWQGDSSGDRSAEQWNQACQNENLNSVRMRCHLKFRMEGVFSTLMGRKWINVLWTVHRCVFSGLRKISSWKQQLFPIWSTYLWSRATFSPLTNI